MITTGPMLGKVSFCIPLFLSILPCLGASVTVITHGFQFGNNYPDWIDTMASNVALRAGRNTSVYRMEIQWPSIARSPSVQIFKLESGLPSSAFTTNAEIVVKVFWHTVAGFTDPANSTDVASLVVPYLTRAIDLGNGTTVRAFAKLPIHLIGHSRGGGVVSEIARLLGEQGVWVDHLTTLDPHPLTDADCVFFGAICPAARDTAVVVLNNLNNVIFADNYYQNVAICPSP